MLGAPSHVVATLGLPIDSQRIRYRCAFFVLRFAPDSLIQLKLKLMMLLRITYDSQRHVCLADTCRLASTDKKQSAYFIARYIATHTHARTHTRTHTVHKPDKSRLNSGNVCYRSVHFFFSLPFCY
jgi:hypothetical protein